MKISSISRISFVYVSTRAFASGESGFPRKLMGVMQHPLGLRPALARGGSKSIPSTRSLNAFIQVSQDASKQDP